MAPSAHATGLAGNLYCFCDYHIKCSTQLIEIGGVGYIWCPDHHILGHIDLVGHQVDIEVAASAPEVKRG